MAKIKNLDKDPQELLEPVERLVKLRKAIDENTALPPPLEEAKKIIRDVNEASSFLAGTVSAAMAILLPLSPK